MIASTGIFKLGTIDIPKIYQGSNLIYESGPSFTPQNLLTWSEEANNWTKIASSTVTSNSINSPTGTLTADTFVVSTNSFGCIIRSLRTITNQEYTLSYYVKRNNYDLVGLRIANSIRTPGDRYPFINLTTLAIDTNTISGVVMDYELLADDWIRVWLTYTPPATTNAIFDLALVASDGNSGRVGVAGESVYLWGRQLNEGPIRPYSMTEGTIIP